MIQVRVKMKPVNTIMTRMGVKPDGDVQMFVTNTVNRRITRYMPFRSGALATKLKHIKSATEIEVLGPYARYQYYGKVMVDPVTGAAGFIDKDGQWKSRTKATHVPKVKTDRDLKYDKTKNPLAGPFWDRSLMANEGARIADDVRRYVSGRKV